LASYSAASALAENLIHAVAGRPSPTPTLQVSVMRSLPVSKGCAASRLRKFSASRSLRQSAILQEQRELVAAEPTDQASVKNAARAQQQIASVAGLVPVRVVDVLEIVDIENDRRKASIRQGHARAKPTVACSKKPRRLLKPVRGSIVASRIKSRCIERIRSAARNPRIKLLGQRRLADEIVGARVERLDQAALIVLARHHQDIDRPAAGRYQPRLPAKLDTGAVCELGAGDQRVDAGNRL
jgi:hypothetical protein